ncbi:MAG TPA: hypothetical protein VFF81_09590 [Noviherbaspirillum sp.]|nr:hypothetical protein [Noviherbaspirillum sp.]
MIRKKNTLSLIVASALVAACGGGGGGGTPTATDNAGTPPANTTPTPTGNTPPGTPPSDPVPTPVADQRFNGHMEMVANQLLYIRANRVIYLPVHMSLFEGSTGIVDVASGSAVAFLPNLPAEAAAAGCSIAVDGTCGVQPSAAAPAAPIAAFGIRVGSHILPSVAGQRVGNQTVVGRIAFDLTEQPGTPGVGAGQVPEIMRFVIDNVEMATDQNGQLTTVRMRDGAQIHVYGRSASGAEVRESIPAPAGTVRLLPLSQIPDGYGDTTSTILFMDLETGFSQAGNKLAALQGIAGHFTMNVTLSHVEKIVRPAAAATPEFPAVTAKDLVGQSITVNSQPPVTGAGISGSAWIRMYPL